MQPNPPAVIDKTLTPRIVNIVGTVLSLVILLVPLFIHQGIWGSNPINLLGTLESLLIGFVIFAIGIVIHEGIHGIGYRLGGAGSSDIHFGFQWKALMPYAHCKVPLQARRYALAVALPGLILGVIPCLIGWVTGSAVITLFGAVMLAGAVGDMLILGLLTTVKGAARVQDHPSKPGFQVIDL